MALQPQCQDVGTITNAMTEISFLAKDEKYRALKILTLEQAKRLIYNICFPFFNLFDLAPLCLDAADLCPKMLFVTYKLLVIRNG